MNTYGIEKLGIVNPKVKGRADMKVVGALVKKLLQGK